MSIKPSLALLATLLLAVLQAAPAQALAPTKVWVSGAGSDASPCTVAQPCASFQHAHDTVAAGGEVSVLNGGDYGQVTITKAISISNDGVAEAGVLVPTDQVGILVQAGVGDVITVRGVVIEGAIGGASGILYQSGSALHVQNCVIRNMQGPSVNNGEGFGILASAFSQLQPRSLLLVSDTVILNSGTGGESGGILVLIDNTGGMDVVLDRVHLENNVFGLTVDGSQVVSSGAHVVVRDSVVSGNLASGIFAKTVPGKSSAFIVVERTTLVTNGGSGILADGPGATVLLSDSTIVRNGTGITTTNSGQLISYGNNRNNNNFGAEGTATGSYVRF